MAGEITALKVQKRNKERVNVYLDGSYAFAVGIMEAAHLKVGQHLGPEQIRELQARDQVQKAYDRALRFLSYRPRSRAEVDRYLVGKGADAPVREEILGRLERLDLIDDEAFAQFWVESRENSRPSGRIALRTELRQKGLDDAIIERALDSLNQEQSADRAASKQARRYHGYCEEDVQKKLSSFLLRRGFPYSVVRSTVTRFVEQLAAEGKLKNESEESVCQDDCGQ